MNRPEVYVPETHRAARVLWRRVVAAHRARVASGAGEYGVGYATGFRDGLSEGYSTVTGVPRQEVGDRARVEAERPSNPGT